MECFAILVNSYSRGRYVWSIGKHSYDLARARRMGGRGSKRSRRSSYIEDPRLHFFGSNRGASDFRIIMRHILPGVVNTIVVLATLRVGGLILAEASLSFLGAGIPAATPTWGNMISEGREWLSTAWWIAVFPGFAILLVVMSVNFLGDWLRDRWDPKLRQL